MRSPPRRPTTATLSGAGHRATPALRHRGHCGRRPKLALGRTHAHTVVTVHVAEHTMTVEFPDGAQRTFTRTTTRPIRRWKAHRPRTPHTDDQPAAGT
jgi:hypothetical protein